VQAHLNEIVDEENSNEKDRDLKAIEIKCHGRGWGLSKTAPTDNDHEWKDEKSNLHARTHGDTDSEIHFVLDSNGDGGRVLGSIAYNWEQDKTNKLLGH